MIAKEITGREFLFLRECSVLVVPNAMMGWENKLANTPLVERQ